MIKAVKIMHFALAIRNNTCEEIIHRESRHNVHFFRLIDACRMTEQSGEEEYEVVEKEVGQGV